MMKKKIYFDSMVVKTVLVVIAVILSSMLIISSIIINISERIFIDTYGKSQEQVFQRIENELNQFHENIVKIADTIDSSWNLKLYLSDSIQEPKLSFQTAYRAKVDMEKAIPDDLIGVSVVAISRNGKSYVDKAETITTPIKDILNSEDIKTVMSKPKTSKYIYMDKGYTATTDDDPAIMMIRSLNSIGDDIPYGVLLITMKEKDFSKYYDYFSSKNSDFYLVNEDDVVVSSSNKKMLNEKMSYEHSSSYTVLKKALPYYKFHAYGIINNQKALGDLYNIPQLWVICSLIMLVSALLVFLLVKQITNPLSDLVGKMSNARINKFDEHIIPTGTREIKELSYTYNSMLDDLNRYIEELMTIQKQKRKAEISALQMQINPHYIYNTLASIKWLIFQGDTEKSTRMIDAFIYLLRNTITNTDEYITVKQEIENLKNYVLINNIRYGEKIQVEYFISFGCEECKVPKMILQPFVENAFFHAFPYEQRGNIDVFIRILDEDLQIKIVDNGVGMNKDRLTEITEKDKKKEHFSGIGVNNVDDRLKLIYGNDYGINIESEENKGTTVTIRIPI